MSMARIFLLTLLFLPILAVSQKQVTIDQARSWVTPVNYVDSDTDTAQVGGYSYLLLERQFNLETKESYFRNVLKVRTEKGLESASSLSINFDPTYQRVTIHSIKVLRNGQVIEKTRSTNVETLRREQNMDRLLYDQSIDVVLNLTDTQVGDVIEYAYSLTGRNPVFNNRWSRTLYFNYSEPVNRQYTRVIVPKTSTVNLKLFNNAKAATSSVVGNNVVYIWDLNAIPSLLSEDNVPTWYDGYDNVEFSQYDSWGDVAQWAVPLYANRKTSAAISNKVQQIKTAFKKADEQINACIEFVQDEIRYLGFEGGIQGYRPHDPSQVFDQRFGDCKDKSLLLSFMLRELGVKSYPALVNTNYGKSINESLPTPTSFNHCIVNFEFQDSSYWIDPTTTLQRGTLKGKTIPPYYHALLINSDSRELVKIPNSTISSSIDVTEKFSMDTIGRSARLTVTTRYTGIEANDIRNYWKSTSAEEVSKSYTDFYSNDYVDIHAARPVEFKDDEKENILLVTEYYTLPEL